MKTRLFKFDTEHVFIISVVLAFGMLFFANAENQEAPDGTIVNIGIGKSFYIPCAIAFVSSLTLKSKKDKLDECLKVLVVVALFTSFIHPPHDLNPLTWTITRFVFAILCFRGLRDVNPILFAEYVSWFSPIIVYLHYILSNPFAYGAYRYGGFYGDANFLALALNIIIAMCYITIMKTNTKILKYLCVLSILGAIPLILVGMSRSGILGLIVVLFFILNSLRKNSKRYFFLVLVTIGLSTGSFLTQFSSIIDLIVSRFMGESQADVGGAMARVEGIESVCNVLLNLPYLIPTGIGLGNTLTELHTYQQYGYYSRFVVHNTYFALLYEAGIVAFFLYLYIYWFAFKSLFHVRNYMLLGLLLSVFISLMTLPGMCFMPAWILLFFLTNKNQKLMIKKRSRKRHFRRKLRDSKMYIESHHLLYSYNCH